VLRLTLAAYRLARTIGSDGAATRSITAGSGLATSELRLLLLDMIDQLGDIVGIAVKLYVDDLTLTATGTRKQVTEKLAQATGISIDFLENLMKLQTSPEKSVVVASGPKLLRRLAVKKDMSKIKPVASAKLLGTPFAGGRRRTTATFQLRLKAAKDRKSRIHAVRAAGGSAVAYVTTAHIPAMLYGSDVGGARDSHRAACRTEAALASAAPTAGKNSELILNAAVATAPGIDPAFVAHGVPMRQWANAVWDKWARPQDMKDAFSRAIAKLDAAVASPWHSGDWARDRACRLHPQDQLDVQLGHALHGRHRHGVGPRAGPACGCRGSRQAVRDEVEDGPAPEGPARRQARADRLRPQPRLEVGGRRPVPPGRAHDLPL